VERNKKIGGRFPSFDDDNFWTRAYEFVANNIARINTV